MLVKNIAHENRRKKIVNWGQLHRSIIKSCNPTLKYSSMYLSSGFSLPRVRSIFTFVTIISSSFNVIPPDLWIKEYPLGIFTVLCRILKGNQVAKNYLGTNYILWSCYFKVIQFVLWNSKLVTKLSNVETWISSSRTWHYEEAQDLVQKTLFQGYMLHTFIPDKDPFSWCEGSNPWIPSILGGKKFQWFSVLCHLTAIQWSEQLASNFEHKPPQSKVNARIEQLKWPSNTEQDHQWTMQSEDNHLLLSWHQHT